MDGWRKLSSPTVYPIIDTDACAQRGHDPTALAEACLRGGARVLQLRAKQAPGGALLALADALVAAARRWDALLIVNDRADIARMSAAAGVHVGQDDLPVDDVRRLLPAPAIVGLSTHDTAQLDAALRSTADYVAVGPIYGTTTKDTGYGARGLDLIRSAAGRGKPVVAIGGITLERAADVAAAGAAALAVISDLLVADPEGRVRAYLRALG